jgi:ABC-type sugar transport system ATPase subunit
VHLQLTHTPENPVIRIGDPLIRIIGLRKSFGGTEVVKGVGLELRAGEIRALCGHNGAGKSTVIKMLSGQLQPDAGAIEIDGEPVRLRSRRQAQRAGIALVDQELSVVPGLTIAENLALGDLGADALVLPARMHRRSRALLATVGLEHRDPAALLSSLSIGERQLVEIARALGQSPRLVVLDEPTATLNDSESELVYEGVRRVAATGCAVVFVSHRLREVLNLCTTVSVLRDGELVASSPASELTVDALIEQMLGEQLPAAALAVPFDRDAGHALTVEGLTIPGVLDDFSIEAHPGRIYGLAGQVGSGTSDVLRALAGLHPAATGHVRLHGHRVRLGDPRRAARAGVAFVSNDRKEEGLFLDKPVGLNLIATRLGALDRAGFRSVRRERTVAARLRESAGIPARVDATVRELSGGNQQKVFLGRTLDAGSHLLLVDEPTRGVDVGGRASIHDLLRAAAAAGLIVIFTSTETEELRELSDELVTMRDGATIAHHASPPTTSVIVRETTHDEGAPR